MDYESLPDAQLRNLYEKLVQEKIKLEEELFQLGLPTSILDAVKQKIYKLERTGNEINYIAGILWRRYGNNS